MVKNDEFLEVLDRVDKTIKKADEQALNVRMLYTARQKKEAYEYSFRLETTVEKLNLLTRALPAYTGVPGAKTEVDRTIRKVVPIDVDITSEGWFHMNIHSLLPKKESGSTEYVKRNVYIVLHNFFKDKQPLVYDKCVIIFNHIYDKNRPERMYRDHDNIEINTVTDAISTYVLNDDNPCICSVYQFSVCSEVESTQVYVVPKTEFIKFLKTKENVG